MSKNDHIVITTEGGGTFRCKNCNAKMRAPLPCSFEMITKVCNQFIKEHKKCWPTKTHFAGRFEPFELARESIDYDPRN